MKDMFGSLIFDSWTDKLPELRATALRDRHLIYEGGGVILDLLLKGQGNGTCIHIGGQVLPGDDSQSSVSDVQVLMEQGGRRSCTHTNALGEFAFHAVPDGTFDLAIVLKDRRFIVRGLSNKEPRMWRVVSSAMVAGGVQ
ncbi:MAG TPA: hypothetical protein VKY31_06635 [Terriglobia bacterium]|jgi:hypothetical protein|nr:hypothetical protein [Terriglobia bacterium]